MPARTSESLILRTYPFREADLIVSFFTRDQGKLRGVARRARRPRGGFGAALERLAHVNATYYQRETRELVTLTGGELLHSQFDLASSYECSIALDYLAEVSEQILPAGELNERHFRLLLAVLAFLRDGGSIWPAVLYFTVWAVRLAGFLPEVRAGSDSRALMDEILGTPIAGLSAREWNRNTGLDLRRLLVRDIEAHIERRLLTTRLLENL